MSKSKIGRNINILTCIKKQHITLKSNINGFRPQILSFRLYIFGFLKNIQWIQNYNTYFRTITLFSITTQYMCQMGQTKCRLVVFFSGHFEHFHQLHFLFGWCGVVFVSWFRISLPNSAPYFVAYSGSVEIIIITFYLFGSLFLYC